MSIDLTPDLDLLIRKYALLNAYRHEGKARLTPVISKVLGERPELKRVIKQLIPHVRRIVEEVNSLGVDDQRRLIESSWPELLVERRREEVKVLPPLPNVERFRRVKTRFAPNPDAPLHLGSARPIILCHEYARMYNGAFILRFEDTDPKTKRPILEVYDWIRDDLLWLGAEWDEEYIQSDRLEIYYGYVERLMERGAAYVCTCRRDVFGRYKSSKSPCPCRSRSLEENLELWDRMKAGEVEEGGAVVRIKTDMAHPNPAIRDWVAFRVINVEKYPHPRPEIGSRYWVWPTYNFACAIDDHELEVSHILRGKEHISNTIKQQYIFKYFGWDYPEAIHFGLLRLTGWVLSKSKIAEGMRRGLYRSWDDPRLGTLKALRRRGFLPESVRELIIQVGVKPVESTISLENLYSINRRFVEPVANRFFFIDEPVTLRVEGVSSGRVVARVPFHPSFPDRGYREIVLPVKNGFLELYVSKRDVNVLASSSVFRLMGLMNLKIRGVEGEFIVADFHSVRLSDLPSKSPIIHWLPLDGWIKAKVVMPDASEVSGICEEYCGGLSVGDRLQFVRFGFVRLDDVDDFLVFYFTHP